MERRKHSRKPVSLCVLSTITEIAFSKAIYLSLLTHRSAISQLRHQKQELEEEVEELKRILKELSEGYNPNYQVCSEVVPCRPVSHFRF